MTLRIICYLLLVTFSVATCAAIPEQHSTAIAWRYQGLEAGLQEAKQVHAPLFLYWGADWCPPCAQLKATLFKSPTFIRKSRQFIMIYLDGDTSNAQQQAEILGVTGYPTLVMMDPAGTEITRIAGGLHLDRYISAMDLALEQVQPVAQLTKAILNKQLQPDEQQLTLLAYHSWEQDQTTYPDAINRIELFRQLSALTPDNQAKLRGRFDAQYLRELTDQETLTPEVKKDAFQRMAGLLENSTLALDNFEFLVFEASDIIKAVSDDGTIEQATLISQWRKQLIAFQGHPELSDDQRLWVYVGLLDQIALSKQPVTPELAKEIASSVSLAIANAKDPYQQITSTYAGYHALKESGQTEKAKSLLQSQVKKNNNPAYWMLTLANLAQSADQPDMALNWYSEAYRQSKGTATRLQWGSYYLVGLVTLSPRNFTAISGLVHNLIDETTQLTDGVAGRNQKAVRRILTSLQQWASEPSQVELLAYAELAVRENCKRQYPQQPDRADCLALTDHFSD